MMFFLSRGVVFSGRLKGGRLKIVTAAIIRHKGRVLIARRAHGSEAGAWEFPGGKLEPGESEEACLARELFEELGIQVEIGPFLAESLYRYNHGQILLRAYEVAWTGGTMQPRVHDRLEWVDLDDLQRFNLLPADVPIAEALVRLQEPR